MRGKKRKKTHRLKSNQDFLTIWARIGTQTPKNPQIPQTMISTSSKMPKPHAQIF